MLDELSSSKNKLPRKNNNPATAEGRNLSYHYLNEDRKGRAQLVHDFTDSYLNKNSSNPSIHNKRKKEIINDFYFNQPHTKRGREKKRKKKKEKLN